MTSNGGDRVNLGTSERPIWAKRNQIESDRFWNRVAVGDITVGSPDGIDLDKALAVASTVGDENN